MTTVYGVALVVGIVLLIVWIVAVAATDMVPDWSRFDPEARIGSRGRIAVAAVVGFGMGGIAASFAGLNDLVTVVAAVAGGAALGAVGAFMGPANDGEDAEAEA